MIFHGLILVQKQFEESPKCYGTVQLTCILDLTLLVVPVIALTIYIIGMPAFGEDRESGLDAKLIVGYQGWFGCPSDFDNNKVWQHWFDGSPDTKHLTVDLLPSLRMLDYSMTCPTGLYRADGTGIQLFSSQDPRAVMTHFRWMKEHAIDGAAVQRFVVELGDAQAARRQDNVLKNVIAAAELTGRLFYLTYDVSGANSRTVIQDIRTDWSHVASDLKVTASKQYLKDHGKPVLELWGFGFVGRPGEPEEVASLIADLHSGSAGLSAAYLVGGVPSGWRTSSGDSRVETSWARIYRSYDALSPWMVGRFNDDIGITTYQQQIIKADIAEAAKANLIYMPVIFPGFSWSNLMQIRNQPDKAIPNQIPRHCGDFLWHQFTGLRQMNVRTLYLAMFDEFDEGTAVISAETLADKLPMGSTMVYLNEDGCALPDDWYLKVAGAIAQYLHDGSPIPAALKSVIIP